ncbi:MAG: VWA domain-containing protein [Chloroflexales bacterium]
MPRLSFIYPEMLWLLLAVGLIWAIALLTPRRLAPWRFWSGLALRTGITLALVLAVAGTQLVLPVQRLTTVFLLDGSDSLPAATRAQAESFMQAALAQMPNDDQAAIVVFGGNALVERAPSAERRLGRITSVPVATRTNLEEAIQLGTALFPADAKKRLVLLSDGGENAGQAVEAARLAAARGIPLDVADLAVTTSDAEALVAHVDAPTHVRAGQTATVAATIESTVAQAATVSLIGDGGVIGTPKRVQLAPGANKVAFPVEVSGTGFQRFRVQIEPERDGRAQNNEAAALIQVEGPPRVLLVAEQQADAAPLLSALQATNMVPVIRAPNAADLPTDLASLSAYEAVILVNTPAPSLPVGMMAALPSYVRDLGKGLLMVGGDQSFGVGGYSKTPVEEALPVYMDVRDRKQRPNLALVFVIDKSGSMDACHCSSDDRSSAQSQTSSTRKVDIAKDAVAQAAKLLGPQDTLGIVSFDSSAVQTLPPTLGVTEEQVVNAMAGVEPRGSTNVHAGLQEAANLLKGVDARLKHIVLLTDGWSAGGDQLDLAQRLRAEGVTISVVAAGGGSANYLERVATTGGGRYYPATDISKVPQIFVQETITTVGNYLVERPFTPVALGASPVLAGITALPQLYGFNGSTLKTSARTLLETDDGEPLLATWQFGLGRSAAWLSDTKGHWASNWVRWADFPRFASQLVGAVLPVRGSQDTSAEVSVAGGETTIALTTAALQASMVVSATLVGTDGTHQVVLHQVAPNRYQGQLVSPAPGTYLVNISGSAADQVVLQETAGLVVPYSSEYRGTQANPALLDELVALTAGTHLTAATDAFRPVAGEVTQAQEVGLPLLLLALCLLPLDTALRRLMLRRSDLGAARLWMATHARRPAVVTPADPTLARLQGAKRRAGARIGGHVPQGEPAPPAPSPAPAPVVTAPPAASAADPLERLRAAKERARKRATGGE